MFWRTNPQKPQELFFRRKRNQKKPDLETSLAAALSGYEKQFYEKVLDAFDYDAEQAKKTIAAA